MNKNTAIVIYWIIAAFITCFAMYITESGWPFLILFIYKLISDEEKNKGDNNNSTTTTSGT